MFSFILLSVFTENLVTAIALCIVPLILGWLAAYAFYKVGALRESVENLTAENGNLNTKVDALYHEGTELRVKITQLDAELENRSEQIRKLKNELIICESERNNLQIAMTTAGGKKEPEHPSSVTFDGVKYKWDDLKIIEGIGPKIAELCHEIHINSWDMLANTNVAVLRKMLDDAGPAFQIHDPSTWPKQAELANRGQWDALKTLQDELKGGKTE